MKQIIIEGDSLNSQAVIEDKNSLGNQMRDGANWFYWIAGLSLLNSAVGYFGSNWSFVIGLGITQFIDGTAASFAAYDMQNSYLYTGIAVALNLAIVGFYFFLGLQARKGKRWSFILGMVLYTLDAFIFLLIMDFLSIGFHALALFFIFKGYKAANALIENESEQLVTDAGPIQSDEVFEEDNQDENQE